MQAATYPIHFIAELQKIKKKVYTSLEITEIKATTTGGSSNFNQLIGNEKNLRKNGSKKTLRKMRIIRNSIENDSHFLERIIHYW